MQTKTKYEETALKELRQIPTESWPQVMNIIRSLKETIFAAKVAKKEKAKESGLCGIWKDDKSADEIIKDIHAHRTGFGERKIDL